MKLEDVRVGMVVKSDRAYTQHGLNSEDASGVVVAVFPDIVVAFISETPRSGVLFWYGFAVAARLEKVTE